MFSFFSPESYMKSGRKYSRMQNVINSILCVVYQSTIINLIEFSHLLGKEFFFCQMLLIIPYNYRRRLTPEENSITSSCLTKKASMKLLRSFLSSL